MSEVLKPLKPILVVLGLVLGLVLVVLHGAQRQCSEQMFGTDSVRNSVPNQLNFKQSFKNTLRGGPLKDL